MERVIMTRKKDKRVYFKQLIFRREEIEGSNEKRKTEAKKDENTHAQNI